MNLTETLIIFINAIAMTFGFSSVLYVIFHTLSKEKISFLRLYIVMYVTNVVISFVANAYTPLAFLIAAYMFLLLHRTRQLHNIISCMLSTAFFFLMMLVQSVLIVSFWSTDQALRLREAVLYNVVNSISFIIISCLMVLFIKKLSKHTRIFDFIQNSPNETHSKKLLYCFAIGMFILAIIISTSWLAGFVEETYVKYYLLFGGIVSVIVVVFAVCSMVVISQTIKQKSKEMEIQKDKEITELYKNEISAMYDNIRDFKHDYMKIFSSISVLLEQDRFDELKTYFNNEILPLHDKTLSDVNNDIHTLANITDIIVQGVIYSYIIKAKHMNINLSIDIQEKIHQHPDISSLDMSRIFGILLDNAFEAAGETNDKIVLFGAVISGSQTIYVVKNQYSVPPDISKIFNPEYSTKGDEHGRGLYIAKKICDKYNTVYLNIYLKDNWFTSETIVQKYKG